MDCWLTVFRVVFINYYHRSLEEMNMFNVNDTIGDIAFVECMEEKCQILMSFYAFCLCYFLAHE